MKCKQILTLDSEYMDIRNIDLNLLHIFVVVYECRSITKAAKQLHLSQPAVSNAITRLNNTLKLTLFIKNSRNIIPTPQAEKLYVDIKSSLQKIKFSLSQQMTFDCASTERTFRIATSNCGELLLFPKLISYLQQNAPNIKINHEVFPKSGFNKQLQNGKIDFVIFVDRPVEQRIFKEPILSDSLVLITGPQHRPLADNLTIDDVVELDLISFGDEYDYFDPLMSVIKQHPAYRKPRLTLSGLRSALYMVAYTKLAMVAPLVLAQTYEKQMQLKIHRLNHTPNLITFYLYWRDENNTDPGHIWLRGAIKDLINSIDKRRVDC